MREIIENLVADALKEAVAAGDLQLDELPDPSVERPKDETHGDWASTVALKCAKQAHKKPRDIAEALAPRIASSSLVENVEVAGPGFINVKLSPAALQNVFQQVREQGDSYGTCAEGKGRKLQIEFVSANPTGPMHVGHGRWAALGDSIANVLAHAGWNVEREYYINDAGNQMDVYANSVVARYLQAVALIKERSVTFAEAKEILVADLELPQEEQTYLPAMGDNVYGGAYIIDDAEAIYQRDGDAWASPDADPEARRVEFREFGYQRELAHIKEVLDQAGVTFDVWFSERTLHAAGPNGKSAIDVAIDRLREAGYIYEKDGATWFKSTEFKDDKDRVLIKADGDETYFAADVAYHANKFDRGYERVIDLWGADHHGYVARVKAAMKALGFDEQFDIVIGQLVNLLRDGKPVRLSKRKGTIVTFEELLKEVGRDATRYLMLSRSTDQQVDFDIEQAKRQDSSNPVYYVQYAHARICSILRRGAGVSKEEAAQLGMAEVGRRAVGEDYDLGLLSDPAELALSRKVAEFPELVAACARDRAPFRLTHYAEELAAEFHGFYQQCQVLPSEGRPVEPELSRARLAACDAVRSVLALTLSLIGVSAPQAM